MAERDEGLSDQWSIDDRWHFIVWYVWASGWHEVRLVDHEQEISWNELEEQKFNEFFRSYLVTVMQLNFSSKRFCTPADKTVPCREQASPSSKSILNLELPFVSPRSKQSIESFCNEFYSFESKTRPGNAFTLS